MTLTKEEIKNWLPIFQAFLDDDALLVPSFPDDDVLHPLGVAIPFLLETNEE